MRGPRVLVALLAFLCAAAPALAAEATPFTFTVPVSLSHLHKNLTLLRVRCWVLPGADWSLTTGALGEGVSGPMDTQLAGGFRHYEGEVGVNVPFHDPRQGLGAARSYRCQIELYDAAGRVWGDAAQIDKRYPFAKGVRAKTETGGLIAGR